MFAVAVTFDIEPENVAAFTDLVCTQARNSLEGETDCHQFDVCIDSDDETRFFLYELYTDEDAFKVHQDTAHFKQFATDSAGLVKDKTVTTLHRIEQPGK